MSKEEENEKNKLKRFCRRIVWPLIATSGLIAIILGSIQNFNCKTITIPQETSNDVGGSLDSGPFSYRTRSVEFAGGINSSRLALDVCRYYSFLKDLGYIWDEDPMTIAVRVFAVFATLLGAVGMAGILAIPCCGVSTCIWYLYAAMLIITGVFQGLSLLIFKSSLCTDNPVLQIVNDRRGTTAFGDSFADDCQVYIGYNCGIASTFLWLLTGFLMLFVPIPEKWRDDWCSGPSVRQPNDENEIAQMEKDQDSEKRQQE